MQTTYGTKSMQSTIAHQSTDELTFCGLTLVGLIAEFAIGLNQSENLFREPMAPFLFGISRQLGATQAKHSKAPNYLRAMASISWFSF